MEAIMKIKKSKFNVEKLKPADNMWDKCGHSVFCQETGECDICGAILNTKINADKLEESIEYIISSLEYYKMIMYNTKSTKAEIKAANKYFKMIPLLENIFSLSNVCDDKLKKYSMDVDHVEFSKEEK
jgi:hypothetical protein